MVAPVPLPPLLVNTRMPFDKVERSRVSMVSEPTVMIAPGTDVPRVEIEIRAEPFVAALRSSVDQGAGLASSRALMSV